MSRGAPGVPRKSSPDPNKKWCGGCKNFVDKSEFGKDSYRYDGLVWKCRPCWNAGTREAKARWRRRQGIPYIEGKHAKHGRAGTPEYVSWVSAKSRTTNPKVVYWDSYGGRGITMCKEWRDNFLAFYKYMGPRPPGHSLDRIENDGNYEPGNVRWATRKQQMRNTRAVLNAKPKKRIAFKKSLLVFLQEWRDLHTGPTNTY